MSGQHNYSDPYARDQHYGHAQSTPFQDSRSAVGQSPQAPSFLAPNQSSEKILDGDSFGEPVQRAHPGRQGLQSTTKSWAEMGPPPRSTGILRMWRKDERGPQWFRGGGLRSGFRLFFCCLIIALITIVSVVLAIALYVRPPNVTLDSVTLGSNPVSLTSTGLNVTFDLGISVSNPNWFNVDFKEIKATAKYPGYSSIPFGGGILYNANFRGYSDSTFQFPLTLNYTTAADPNRVILNDLISKCGVSGGEKQDITIDYDLDLKLRVVGITVDPRISSSASFLCPISASDIQSIIGSSN
ncbi:hypothetical protein BD324DRAFT_650295 [Kockovaella imperatae]|uniref:Late embryogenesis abundant protein LEA-2 subgroup domain-containing protein n=1 Tax=Kockovaella imperatae TaxID=4999 RepID=A0A1Y1UJV2_9TREE|nr:hypothetical protein BD324DRAFT_650295 [Kockovaella imperatae]ORX37746.1 hypothetical protein BD324DRAFT_650295 [Kockovaella imperatae]